MAANAALINGERGCTYCRAYKVEGEARRCIQMPPASEHTSTLCCFDRSEECLPLLRVGPGPLREVALPERIGKPRPRGVGLPLLPVRGDKRARLSLGPVLRRCGSLEWVRAWRWWSELCSTHTWIAACDCLDITIFGFEMLLVRVPLVKRPEEPPLNVQQEEPCTQNNCPRRNCQREKEALTVVAQPMVSAVAPLQEDGKGDKSPVRRKQARAHERSVDM